jgi:hypothetical protein
MTDIPDDVIRDMFGFAAPTEQQLSSIGLWASKALELHAYIDQINEQLAALNKELAVIEEVNLPTALLEAGLSEFKMTNGSKITIKDVIAGGMSKDIDKRQFTLDWITDNGGIDIIKTHFEIDYTKGQKENALAFRHLLQKEQIHFDEFESIHAMTLYAFLREKLKEGDVPPFENMGLYFAKKAEVKPAKEKK